MCPLIPGDGDGLPTTFLKKERAVRRTGLEKGRAVERTGTSSGIALSRTAWVIQQTRGEKDRILVLGRHETGVEPESTQVQLSADR